MHLWLCAYWSSLPVDALTHNDNALRKELTNKSKTSTSFLTFFEWTFNLMVRQQNEHSLKKFRPRKKCYILNQKHVLGHFLFLFFRLKLRLSNGSHKTQFRKKCWSRDIRVISEISHEKLMMFLKKMVIFQWDLSFW